MFNRIATLLVFFALLTLGSGCVSYHTIKPSEAPKLNGAFVSHVGNNTVAVRVAHVEKPDGSLVEIEGEFGFRVTTKSGKTESFDHPARAVLDGGSLTFSGSNRGPVTIDISDLKSVEVTQTNEGAQSTLIAVAITLPLILLFALVA